MNMLQEFKIDYDILIVNPNLHVSTKWAFEKLNLQPGISKEPVLNNVQKFDTEKKNLFVNDFEDIVFKRYDDIKNNKR